MSTREIAYLIPSEAAEAEIRRALAERFATRNEAAPKRHVTYYETFDWRIHRAGGTLRAVAGRSDSIVLRWDSLAGERLHEVRVGAPPAFAWDLPAGAFREALEPAVAMRRLLPRVELERRGDGLRVLDERDKTVVRVRFEHSTATAGWQSDGASRELPARLCLRPVRGFDEALASVAAFLEEQLALEPTETSPFAAALAALGLEPGASSATSPVELEPDMRADEATREVLRNLFHTMEVNEAGTRQNLDSEFLHDFRVAIRRTRSALGQIKGVFSPEVIDPFRTEFAWLGQLTGPTRDLDVYLLKMDDYKASLPEAVQNDLTLLDDFLHAHHELEHRALVAGLDSERYRRLLDAWRRFLAAETPAASGPSAPNAARPIREVAAERIWKIYRRVRKRGRAITAETPAEALHRLRIDCKKLRYLLEFFRSLFDPGELEPAVRTLKRLQDTLGDFNDYEVQQGKLKEFAHQMLEEVAAGDPHPGQTPIADTLMAMGRLVSRLERGQEKERQRFHKRFAAFAGAAHHQRFRRLFKL